MTIKASDGREFSVTVSAGVAAYQQADDSGALLLKQADEALYNAKKSGRNRYMAYDSAPGVIA